MIFLTLGLQYLHEDLNQVPTNTGIQCLFVLNGTEGITKHILNYIWAIISQNNNVQSDLNDALVTCAQSATD